MSWITTDQFGTPLLWKCCSPLLSYFIMSYFKDIVLRLTLRSRVLYVHSSPTLMSLTFSCLTFKNPLYFPNLALTPLTFPCPTFISHSLVPLSILCPFNFFLMSLHLFPKASPTSTISGWPCWRCSCAWRWRDGRTRCTTWTTRLGRPGPGSTLSLSLSSDLFSSSIWFWEFCPENSPKKEKKPKPEENSKSQKSECKSNTVYKVM